MFSSPDMPASLQFTPCILPSCYSEGSIHMHVSESRSLCSFSYSSTRLLKMPSLWPTPSNFSLHGMISNKDKCAGISLTLNEQPELPAAAAAAKSLQSCLTLCDPIDGSPPCSPVPRILQARTLQRHSLTSVPFFK